MHCPMIPQPRKRNGNWRTLLTGSLLAGMILGSAPAVAGMIYLDGVGGGLSHIKKPVTSIREGRFKNLIEQRYDFSCGAAAVATILKYAYNHDVTEIDVLQGMAKVSDEALVQEMGFSLLDIRNYVETLGLRGRGYQIPASTLHTLRIPTIVLLDIRGYKHFVVLKRVVEDMVFVGDPALGNRTMTMDDFIASWNGTIFAVVGQNFDRDTILSDPDAPLTMRKFWQDAVPLSDSDLLDFGFQYSDLF